jgi:putative Ca2+/H+ antiporter (TMEM165/GDT1 family)
VHCRRALRRSRWLPAEALFAVAAIAVVGGQALPRFVNIATIRKVTAVVLLALAAFSLWTAVR